MLLKSDVIFAVVGAILVFENPVLIPIVVTIVAMEFWKRFNTNGSQNEDQKHLMPIKEQFIKLANGYSVLTFAEEAETSTSGQGKETAYQFVVNVYVTKTENF